MTLCSLVDKPDLLLSTGQHMGYQWVIIHNGMGYRCGYVRIPKTHPWYGRGYDEINVDIHGGLTFSREDKPTNKIEADIGYWWLGFDCAHYMDAIDPSLPHRQEFRQFSNEGIIRTQEYVESECRSLCEQAERAADN